MSELKLQDALPDGFAWTEHEKIRLALMARLHLMFELLRNGCMDGSCVMHPPRSGMHTNGGCKCYRYMTADLLDAATLADTVKPYRFKTWRRVNEDNGVPVITTGEAK